MKNKWLLMVSFLAGSLVGALAYATVDSSHREVRHDLELIQKASESHESYKIAESPPIDGAVIRLRSETDIDERWVAVSDTLSVLNRRVTELEAQLADITRSAPTEDEEDSHKTESGELSQNTLMAAGVTPGVAEEIMQRQSQLEMQRLELRDQASREGWIDSERFFDAIRKLNGDAGLLRDEIGDEAYDRFLYLTGQPNRVVISSIIQDSPAQYAGIEPGDIIIGYADNRVFSWSELRNATREGNRGEDVLIQLQRNGEIMELALPRGPMGVRLDSEQIDPDDNT